MQRMKSCWDSHHLGGFHPARRSLRENRQTSDLRLCILVSDRSKVSLRWLDFSMFLELMLNRIFVN